MGSKVSKTPAFVHGPIRRPSDVSDVYSESEESTYHPPPAGVYMSDGSEYGGSYSNDNYIEQPQEDYFRSLTNTDYANVPPPNTSLRDDDMVSPTLNSVQKVSTSPISLEDEEPAVSAAPDDNINDNLTQEDVLEEEEFNNVEEENEPEAENTEEMEEPEEESNEQEEENEDVISVQEESVHEMQDTEESEMQNEQDGEPEIGEEPVQPENEETGSFTNEDIEESENAVESEKFEEEPYQEVIEQKKEEINNVKEEIIEVKEEEKIEVKEEKVTEVKEKKKKKKVIEKKKEEVVDVQKEEEKEVEVKEEKVIKEEVEDFIDTTVSPELSMYFAQPYLLTFDFSMALTRLRPVQDFVTKMGFLRTIPTPDVLERAQKGVKHFGIIAPKSDYGFHMPFPYHPTAKPEQADLEEIEEAFNLTDTKSFSKFVAMVKSLTTIQDQEVKIRFIMNWITKHFDKIPPLESNGPKSSFQGSPQAEIFSKLCKMANVNCVVIEGQRKIYSLEPSPNAEKRSVKAKWCAVLIKSKWRFVDPSMPAYNELMSLRLMPTATSELFRVRYIHNAIADFYYLPDPICFVYTHLPDDYYWQLLCRPVLESEWQNLVCVSPLFFYNGFELQSKVTYNVKVGGGPLIFSFIYPVEKLFKFATKIVPSPSKNGPYTCIESDLEVKALSIQVYLPKKGNYFLHIYFQDLTETNSDFIHLCTYSLEASKGNTSENDTYFANPRQHWGPADDTLLTGLVPHTHLTSEIECNSQFFDIVFDLEKKQDFECSLVDKDGRDFTRFLVFWEHNRKMHIKVSCPGFQKLALHIFVKNKEAGSKTLICNYYVQFISSHKDEKAIVALPDIKMLGVTEAGVEAGLKPLSDSPFSVTISKESKFEFEIESDCSNVFPTLRYMADKLYAIDSYMLWYFENKKLVVFINPFRSGMYLLSIQNIVPGKKKKSTMTLVLYNGMVNVDIPSKLWSPYAGRIPGLNKMYKVVEPKSGYLCAKTEYQFAYEIKDAQDVAIVGSDGWSHLSSETTPGLWEATITTGVKGTEAKLNVRYEIGKETFTTLLAYKLITEEEFQERDRRQDQYRREKLEAHAQDDEFAEPPRKLISFWSKQEGEKENNEKEDKKPKKKGAVPPGKEIKRGINNRRGNLKNENPEEMDFKTRRHLVLQKANNSDKSGKNMKTRGAMAARIPVH